MSNNFMGENFKNLDAIRDENGDIVYHDSESKELMEGMPVWIKPKYSTGRGTVMIFQANLGKLKNLKIKDEKTGKMKLALQGNDYRVIFAIIEYIDFENWLRISQRELADDLGVNKVVVSKSFKKLKELGIIEAEVRNGFTEIRLGLKMGWKGKVKTLLETEDKRKEQIRKELEKEKEEKRNKEMEDLDNFNNLES